MNLEILKGVRVVDLTSVILGPYATQILADMGADVIKVENPDGGDILRRSVPRRAGLGAAFLNLNRNKRSIALDLGRPDGVSALRDIIKTADVFMHNMRDAAIVKLGLDYAGLKKVNPKLVYCASWGFGSNGPYAGKPAFDDIIQSLSGAAALQTRVRGRPGFLPTAVVDKMAGLSTAYAVAMGLFHRERTGEGLTLEVPMFEAMVSFLFVEHLGAAAYVGDGRPAGHPRQFIERGPFATTDGCVAVMPYTTKQWQRFFTLAGREDLANDPRVTDDVRRNENIGEVVGWVAEVVALRSTNDWLRVLEENDIPVARVNGLDDVLDDPHLAAVGLLQRHNHPTEGPLRLVSAPVLVNGKRPQIHSMAPDLGQQTREILQEVGMSATAIQALLDSGTAAEPAKA